MSWAKDTSKKTGDSSKKAAKAAHDARDQSGARSGEDKKLFEKAPQWAKNVDTGKVPLFPKDK